MVSELKELKGKEIAVTMADGQAYRGRLEAYDERTVVLTEVFEASNDEIDWRGEDSGRGEVIRGYIPWRKVTLPKVIMLTHHILRIWPWQVPKN